MAIDVNEYTEHKSPGKFGGESAATEYFYEQMMNGDGETIFGPATSDDETYDDETVAELFQVSAEESEAFGLTVGCWFLLREDSQGFCYGSQHETREEAEAKFADWIGA